MIYAARSHAGAVRPVNEDRFGIWEVAKDATLFAVCDGLGGQAGGEVASELVRDSFAGQVKQALSEAGGAEAFDSRSLSVIKAVLRDCVSAVNRELRAAQSAMKLPYMASTLVAALVTSRRVYVLHVGDSRLYTVSDAGVEQVTRDHSYVQYLLDIGRITPAEAVRFGGVNYMTRAMGAGNVADADFRALSREALPSPTYLLLCTDGLYRPISGSAIADTVLSGASLEDKADALMSLALAGGGEDDLTVILAELS